MIRTIRNILRDCWKGLEDRKTKRNVLIILLLAVMAIAPLLLLHPEDEEPEMYSETEHGTKTEATAIDETLEKLLESDAAEPPELSPGILNLRYLYPEGADEEALNSYAGAVYKELIERDRRYIADIYELSAESPRELAGRLGISGERVLGGYNPNDKKHDKDRADGWYISSFKNVNFRYINGDSEQTDSFSNIKEIMSLANVYCYYHDYTDYDKYRVICNELYSLSHSYKLSLGKVYYDDGCIQATVAQSEPESPEEESLSDDTVNETEENSLSREDEPSLRSEEKLVEMNGESYRLVYGEPDDKGRRSIAFLPAERDNTKDNVAEQELFSSASPSELASENETEPESIKEDSLRSSDDICPGHIDLNVAVRVLRLSEKQGLCSLLPDCCDDWAGGEGWAGWTEENISAARALSECDWYSLYGISASTTGSRQALYEEEISHYIDSLPEETADERIRLVRFALSSVGRVPYYWGGKANKPGYEGNDFGMRASEADYKGRILRGLDCSGWVQWVYWSALNDDLDGDSGTGELIDKGKKIRRSELKPGDIIIKTGDESHVVMFLEWAENGKIIGIHESSEGNNVSVDELIANYPYYRCLVQE